MKVSIIIPIYNSEKYLQECIDSVIQQTWKDIEVILIDDGSTDGSAEICQQYLSDDRVIYHYQKNAGVSEARNTGLSFAAGEYICFVDSDDWLELDAIERLQGETADIVIYNFYHGNKKHVEPLEDGVYHREYIFPKLISYIDVNGNIAYIFHNIWMRLFKKELIVNNEIRFSPQFHNGEDLLFTFEASLKATTISVRCSEYLYHYRPTQNSLTNKYIANYWELRKRIIKKMYELIDNDILHNQMPLRIFSWAVTGIENEFKYAQGSKDSVQAIVKDSICNVFKGKLDISNFNEKNKRFYKQICKEDSNGIWRDYRRQNAKQNRRRFMKSLKKIIKKLL